MTPYELNNFTVSNINVLHCLRVPGTYTPLFVSTVAVLCFCAGQLSPSAAGGLCQLAVRAVTPSRCCVRHRAMEALSTDLSAGLRVGAESGQTDTAGGPSSDTTGVPSSDTAADSSPAGEHRLDQYKNAARLSDSQHARRQELLRRQKR